ncbi:PRC-barrel domain-containing protein [Mesorhizobium sp. YIM 152430]|uniref:PRC-barrel domain-containing protein n=1 Tax=Mesorhizobium sp. YIM 152430 TaxID=3031761 RepID=UPI0023DC6219|nr:PRC-barrel domain-containing protein [Mesorhizobium sp. YIM 152430]MDF1600886.1 PRC-barrel domain-containing protein [Mesorhizobium sp. YIM 152430]
MFIKLASTTAIATAMLALTATGAGAQQNPQTNDQTQMAEACLLEMNEFAERMYEDEFWLSGWGTGSYGAPPAPQSTQSPATTAPATGDTTSRATSAKDIEASAMDPRGEVVGIDAPRYQIRALYGAGRVLAYRGDNEGCEYIVAKMNKVYDSYSQQLEEAGVDPASVTTWRQERLALAEPLAADATTRYRIDNITGTDVRNMEDENLGSVSDVIIDPESGKAAYVIVARGGFLGMGEDHYAIPWDEVRAAPGLEVVVVDRTAAELDEAPAIDPDRFRNPGTMMDERRTTDEFWTQRG